MKRLMESWRRFVTEEMEQPVREEMPTQDVPGDLYHVTRPPMLSTLARDGIRDYTDYSKMAAKQQGVSFCTQLESIGDGAFGKLILVVDGGSLAESGEFRFHPHQDPKYNSPEAEIQVSMQDSASGSGAGLDPKVDSLGTQIPFTHVKKMIFLYPPQEKEQSWLKKNFPNIPYESYDHSTGAITEYLDDVDPDVPDQQIVQ
jgi:hypothetical protein